MYRKILAFSRQMDEAGHHDISDAITDALMKRISMWNPFHHEHRDPEVEKMMKYMIHVGHPEARHWDDATVLQKYNELQALIKQKTDNFPKDDPFWNKPSGGDQQTQLDYSDYQDPVNYALHTSSRKPSSTRRGGAS